MFDSSDPVDILSSICICIMIIAIILIVAYSVGALKHVRFSVKSENFMATDDLRYGLRQPGVCYGCSSDLFTGRNCSSCNSCTTCN